ncbi:MAG: serine/threonine protein kinase [Hyphomicrobiales bacterium]
MAEETPTGLLVGDRSQGYEVTGSGDITGLNATYAGKDTRDRDAVVTLIQLSDDQDTSPLFDLARTFEQIDRDVLVGPRTVVRFGTGSAVVVGKEQGAPLAGETLAIWLQRRAPLPLSQTARLFLPLIEALGALHARGIAHGRISASQVLVDRDDKARLLGPWLAYGGEPLEQFQRTQAPELVSGEAPSPVSDVYSLCALLRWSLTGKPPPSADERLTSKAQRDEDPLTSMSEALPDLDTSVARALETGLRLHPATRPQSMAALGEVLEPHVGEAAQGVSAPPPLPSSPWPQKGGDAPSDSAASPPPIPASRPRTGGVPPIPKASRTSTIGQAPPPIPPSGGSGGSVAKPKRKIGIGTILSFAIALGIAWAVASGGLFSDDQGSSVDAQRDSNRPTQIDVDDEPRKGPRTADREDDSTITGVRQQLCNSRFTFETARDAGSNALRAYLQECDGIDSDYVEAARDALGLN